MEAVQNILSVRGMFRLQLGEDENGKPKIMGDSGWKKNEVMNDGFQNYICALIGSLGGSVQVQAMCIGTGGVPNVTDSLLPGSVKRQSCGKAIVASKTLRCTLSIASGDHPGGTPDIANIALINSTASAGTIMCGNTFDSSTWNSNQGLSATYDLVFATA